MIELPVISRDLSNLLKAKVVGIRFFKRKDHVDEVLSQLGNIGDPFSGGCDTDHGLGWVKRHWPGFLEFFREMKKQFNGMS